ncbi:MAG: ABC transporter substrate-binding protein [Gracilimonas sp.]|uniref:helical backbone metal receptor n=1 Tax=Gracilimonas sp. TaxID=1974203 RepID=UPI001999C96C|nr:helical backbone metal receptor [Gracilimonas sp.]MBD3617331.1 ABC transporter substrate-binding protein [Gracilimonas sp.]
MPDLPYQRIISLVPSLTELLIDLGLKDHLAGRTRFCVHPKTDVDDIEIIGGTKNPRLGKIIEMDPDLIIANKEENRKEDIEDLSKYTKVQVTEIDTIQDALLEISGLGLLLGVNETAQQLITNITDLLSKKPEVQPLSTAYFIWKDPWMTVGSDTYIHNVMQEYQLHNVFGDQTRYPQTSLKSLASKNPDLILLSSEPYPFKEKHIKEIRKACPVSKIELVNGEWFSWYGSRMISAFKWLNNWRSKI